MKKFLYILNKIFYKNIILIHFTVRKFLSSINHPCTLLTSLNGKLFLYYGLYTHIHRTVRKIRGLFADGHLTSVRKTTHYFLHLESPEALWYMMARPLEVVEDHETFSQYPNILSSSICSVFSRSQ